MKLKKFEGNPILSPSEKNDWESLVTCNPGVFYDNGMFYMLYRAAGNDREHVIRLGLATSRDGFYLKDTRIGRLFLRVSMGLIPDVWKILVL